MSRFTGLNEVPGTDTPLLVAPRLRQDDMGREQKSCTLSERDRRRIVSVSHHCSIVYLFRFNAICIFCAKLTVLLYDE